MFTVKENNSEHSEKEKKDMFKKHIYFVEVPGIMGCEMRKLTERQAEALRQKGYTVTR